MATAMINGRRTEIPDAVTTDAEIRRIGGIDARRNLIRRTREGNYLVARGSSVRVNDGDVFMDAPARVKGARSRGA
jgi:hypothetical protein